MVLKTSVLKLLLAALGGIAYAGAFAPQPRALPPPAGRVPGDFTRVGSVSELSDAYLLIADRREQRLEAVNIERQSIAPIGRRGQGPLEYQTVQDLTTVGGDTTLMIDAQRARWLVIAGTSIVETLLGFKPAEVLRANFSQVYGVDRSWRVLFLGKPSSLNSSYVVGPNDSLPLHSVLRTGRLDTIAFLRRAPFRRIVTRGIEPGEYFRSTVEIAWSVGESAAICQDGWIAILRLDPYRVDWRSPSGQWRRGAPIAHEALRVTEREKAAYIARLPTPPDQPPVADPPLEWPAQIPPVAVNPPMCASDGRLFVKKSLTADRQFEFYDIIDRIGNRIDQLRLGGNQRLVGFGRTAAYAVTRDSFDVERLFRYKYPW